MPRQFLANVIERVNKSDFGEIHIESGTSDVIDLGRGRDLAYGGGGDDTFVIESGKKVLFGGTGDDTFQFLERAMGKTTISDFGRGNDVLDLSALGVTGLDDLTIRETRFGTKIEVGDLDIVLNVKPDQLDVDDFRFADPDGSITIDFDDIDLGGEAFAPMPQDYRGLQWDNFFVIDTEAFAMENTSGYVADSVPNVAFNGFGNRATLSSDENFDLESITMAGAWQDGLNIGIEAFDDGQRLGRQDFTLSYGTPEVFELNDAIFDSVDEVRFYSFGGGNDNPFDDGTGRQIVLDDFVIV
jgi:hypothetical protein